jgi:hypothetical protein
MTLVSGMIMTKCVLVIVRGSDSFFVSSSDFFRPDVHGDVYLFASGLLKGFLQQASFFRARCISEYWLIFREGNMEKSGHKSWY